MRLPDERCQLLLAVYPAFVAALPIVSSCSDAQYANSPKSLLLDNTITELRDEIRKVAVTFNEEVAQCELLPELFDDARIALDLLLCFFDGLVHSSIAEITPNEYKDEVFFNCDFVLPVVGIITSGIESTAADRAVPQPR